MTAQFRISVGLTFLLSLLLAISVQAQTDAVLAVDVISGSIEISIDGGTTYATAATGMQLEPNHQVRWSDDAAGSLIGPDSLQVMFDGADLGAGELRVDAVDDPDTTSGLRLQQLAGQVIYARENDLADLDMFLVLEEDDQLLECTNRQADYVNFIPDPAITAAEAAAPLADAVVKVIDSSDESYGLLSSGWLFAEVNEEGQFKSNRWTMDANFEVNIAGLRLRRDTTQPDYTIVDRYCHDVVLTESTTAAKTAGIAVKPLLLQQEPLPFVVPEPGTTIEYTVDPETGAITITMSPGGQASFIVPEGGLPAGVTILVDGFEIELDTTQAGSLTLASSGDGQLSASMTGGSATITSPQGVVVTLNSPDPTEPAQAAITDPGTGPVVVQPLTGNVSLETNGTPTTVIFPDGSTIDIPAGDYGLDIVIEPNGAVQVAADPENPGSLLIVPPVPADGTEPPPPIVVAPGEQTGPICPGGVQPSGIGGACPPV